MLIDSSVHVFLIFCIIKWKVWMKHFCCVSKRGDYAICCLICELNTTFFHRTSWLQEWLSDKHWLFALGFLTDIFRNRMKYWLALQRKQLTVFVSRNKIQVYKQNLENLHSPHSECNCDISFLYCIMKHVNIWKFCITEWTNIFHITNAYCDISMHV